jgi:hypothetical protein
MQETWKHQEGKARVWEMELEKNYLVMLEKVHIPPIIHLSSIHLSFHFYQQLFAKQLPLY